MIFKEYEGFKKIENTKQYTLEQIYDLIKQYQDVTGEVKYAKLNDELKIIVDVEGKYYIDIYLDNKYVIIERKLEAGSVKESENIMNDSKSLALAHADRMIEQIYDLLNEYILKGTVTEHITKAQKVLYAKEQNRILFKGAISIGKAFDIIDENNKKVYEIKQNLVNKIYSINNLETKREEASLKYKMSNKNEFSLLILPYELINLKKDEKSTKTRFISKLSNKEIEIKADFTDNHYLIELNKIVIGSIDCLDPDLRQQYRIEINDLKNTSIILCLLALIDIIHEINI